MKNEGISIAQYGGGTVRKTGIGPNGPVDLTGKEDQHASPSEKQRNANGIAAAMTTRPAKSLPIGPIPKRY